jgi:hypothetical protein
VIPASITRKGEREEIAGERDDRWGLAVGEREGGKVGLGWFGGELGRLAPGCGPSGLLALLCIFFFLFSFSFVFDFCFGFLKKLFYSDLNKNKADHFGSLKSVFETYKPRVW